ncbi:hypothetical protein PV382_23405 [Streptomyces scabiei]|uniref:hypothetical protein n=1 Tax=Streptomyces scabiei TaxID=1930 RepID=UPI0029AA5708|nr:hypothetical protein [Streptomyces scabiei]MDX2658364.1 hypothetical protein [Streptomyces scabiei]MDX2870520.1 hypothetical protein [Streptomyces scabiei]MDX3175200.1 hypothetical protein [Streptomyces scabiei]
MSEHPEHPQARGVRIDAQPGHATIALDGNTLPQGVVTGYVLEHSIADAFPMLVLHTRQTRDVAFEGLARVAVAVQQDPGQAVADFVLGLDPAAVQRAALDRSDLSGGKTEITEAILKQIAEWATGGGGQ